MNNETDQGDDFEPVNTIRDILTAKDVAPSWLIPELILRGAFVALAGEPGAGKSYISYTIGLAVASGSRALSGLVPAGRPMKVAYFDEENSLGDRNKYLQRSYQGLIAANFSEEPDMDALQDNFWPIHFHLGCPEWKDIAAQWIDFIQPDLIIFDTATPAFAIDDENDNAMASKAIKGVRELMAMTTPTAAAIVLKHAKVRTEKGGRRSMRGAKAWQGAADGVMFQVKAPGRPRKDGLSLTRLEPDKTRAYGLTKTIYITPEYADASRNALMLHGSYEPDHDHERAMQNEDADLPDRR